MPARHLQEEYPAKCFVGHPIHTICFYQEVYNRLQSLETPEFGIV